MSETHNAIATEPTKVQANVERMQAAARNLYYAAHWTPDREVDAEALWTELRDAFGFEPGNAPAAR